jgi:hypothetical protein
VLPPWVESELSHAIRGAKITPEDVADEIATGLPKERSTVVPSA